MLARPEPLYFLTRTKMPRLFKNITPEGLMDDMYSHLSIKVGAPVVGTGE